jgi:hypothetical protein
MYDAPQIAVALDEPQDTLSIGHIELGEAKIRRGTQLGEARLLQADIVIVIQIIHAQHPVTAREQRFGDVEADEPGNASEKDRHEPPMSAEPFNSWISEFLP